MPVKTKRPVPVIGWREWVGLPELGVDAIKVKVDTGARSSALHAFALGPARVGEVVHFEIHPVQRKTRPVVRAEAVVVDLREVRSSTGVTTLRPVVHTPIRIGGEELEIELTLVRRDVMGFRMLLGRQAIRGRYLVDPGRSFLVGKRPKGGRS